VHALGVIQNQCVSASSNDREIARDGRLRAGELEAGELADAASAAITADEVLGTERPRARLHAHPVPVLLETIKPNATTQRDPELARARALRLRTGWLQRRPLRTGSGRQAESVAGLQTSTSAADDVRLGETHDDHHHYRL
jgi:hypothetical protein